jgi:hypothetical protein
MLAMWRLIEPLQSADFRIWKQTRTGLLSYPPEPAAARAHLAASVYLQMMIQPHIIHVVGHTEADHAATADDVIESCTMANRAIQNALGGAPDGVTDPRVQARAEHLVREAQVTLQAIRAIATESAADPLTDPAVLSKAVALGIMDAPQLRNNPFARGEIAALIIGGACEAVSLDGEPISESERLKAHIHD